MQTSSLERYDYIRRLDAVCDLFTAALGIDAQTPEELMPHFPALLENLSEYHAVVAMQVQPEVIAAILKPKNRNAVSTHILALKSFLTLLTEKLDQGKPVVAYFPSSMTTDIFLSMDLAPLPSELFSLYIAAIFINGVEDELDIAENQGFPGHVCAFQKSSFTAIENGHLPVPDVFVKTSSPCDSSNMMYQYVVDRYRKPILTVDSPYYSNSKAFRYFLDEFKRMLEDLEKITGHTIDEDLLRAHVEMGNRQLGYLYRLQNLRKHSPNPDPGMHRALDTAALFLSGVSESFVDYMKTCYHDAQFRIDQGKSFLPDGKKEIRTLWSYSFTPHTLYLPDWLEEEFGSTYLECSLSLFPGEIVGYVNTSTLESMIEGIAWRSFNCPMHRTVMTFSDLHVRDIVTVAKTYRADAAIFGGNHSCKYAWTLPKMLSDALSEELGIPCFTWETDLVDKRFAPPVNIKQQLSQFFMNLL
jgi:benzoyl-CoA reductase/2-hydroxyglutaryl-CoA dehydratase subunit BcrC/BadD/HgdB